MSDKSKSSRSCRDGGRRARGREKGGGLDACRQRSICESSVQLLQRQRRDVDGWGKCTHAHTHAQTHARLHFGDLLAFGLGSRCLPSKRVSCFLVDMPIFLLSWTPPLELTQQTAHGWMWASPAWAAWLLCAVCSRPAKERQSNRLRSVCQHNSARRRVSSP